MGLGHARYGSNPDYTYDHWSWIGLGQPGATDWDHNAKRTLQAELNIYQMLLTNKTINPNGKRLISDEKLEEVLNKFNAIHESENDGYKPDDPGNSEKVRLLQKTINSMPGVEAVEWLKGENLPLVYSKKDGKRNRDRLLCSKPGVHLDQKSYAGTILPSSC